MNIRFDELLDKPAGMYNIYVDNYCTVLPDFYLRIFEKNRSHYTLKTIIFAETDRYPKWFNRYIDLVMLDQKEDYNVEIVLQCSKL